MKYLMVVLVSCLIGYVTSSLSVQGVIDIVFSSIKNKEEFIENNPGLVDHIYRYFQEIYPRDQFGRTIDFKNHNVLKYLNQI